jgi:hypothetical protein
MKTIGTIGLDFQMGLTKRLILLITEICIYKQGLFLIEEPELGVHPHQVNNLTLINIIR